MAEDNSRAIGKIAFGSAYVNDFEESFRFYSQVLGLTKKFDMGENACYFAVKKRPDSTLKVGARQLICSLPMFG